MRRAIILLCLSMPLLGGCVARGALDAVTAPVRAAGQVADWATTSQDEADRALGRRVRERDAEIGRLERRRERAARDCAGGDADACATEQALNAQIADLASAPIAPED